ncbi:hypothetical protein BS47DRAFT_1356440 [Hydnum rufescens UP504]|uniref:Uncharacterized protein n=1 Tax=Hydnum rufescens UP504 TaxID=1448309 RepID=A0A9P6ACA5_9AGAM|nr:hypothetical protein BS47DRAFT_1356440 [Hydnum rufescens UP504]
MAIGLSSNQYFPTLVAMLGYSRTIMLLLCAPPWGFVTVIMFIVARHADKTGEHFFHIISLLSIGTVGFIIALSMQKTGPRYFALFIFGNRIFNLFN